ncbi:MAG: rhodanese-like domain-containing protein [Spirochaetota bacterium]
MFGKKRSKETDLDATTFEQELDKRDGAVLIDVRTPAEFAEGHLPHALNIDIYGADFSEAIGKLDKNAPTFLYCRTGNRSGTALQAMKQMGFSEVYHLERGIIDWHGTIER